MKRMFIFAAGVCLCGLSTPSFAQSSDYEAAFTSRAMEARIGVTIPFGGTHGKAQSKPQFALGLRQETTRTKSHDWALKPGLEGRQIRELKLSMTMEKSPSFLMNDQLLNFDRDELTANGTANALDRYDKTVLTVIGASLVVIAGTIIIISD